MNIFESCGPIEYPGLSIKHDTEGVETLKEEIYVPTTKPTPWNAHWIWLSDAEFSDLQESANNAITRLQIGFPVALFRKSFELDSDYHSAFAWMSADCKYRIYINGKLVGRGPANVGGDNDLKTAPDWWFYDQYDWTPFLQIGVNIITVEVSLYPQIQSEYSMGHGGLLLEMEIHETNHIECIVTDDSWKAIPNDAAFLPLIYDAVVEPLGWHLADFNDSEWPFVQDLGLPEANRWNLIPREIPPLGECRIYPEQVHLVSDPDRILNINSFYGLENEFLTISPGSKITLTFSFDKEYSGFIQFCLNGTIGTKITLGFQEMLEKTDRTEVYLLREGTQNYETFQFNSFQHIKMEIEFDAKNLSAPLELYALAINFCSFPVNYRGKFECSDDYLNIIWEVGRWTDQICMQNIHFDSPVTIHQEPLGCTGDYMIEALIAAYTFGEYRLARQDILRTSYALKMRDSHMFHTSYSLLWIQMVRDYYQFSGDLELVRTVAPEMHQLLAKFQTYIGEDTGILSESPNYLFMDWVQVDQFTLHHPPSVIGQGYLTAYYYKALLNAAELCEFLSDEKQAQLYGQQASAIAQAFNNELWVEERELYCDGRPFKNHNPICYDLPADVDKLYFSIQTNAVAIAFGIAPEERWSSILEIIMNDSTMPVPSPYFNHFIFAAFAKAGEFEKYGFKQMDNWRKNLEEHPTSWKEGWEFGDYSHAWSGTTTYQLSARFLGVMPSSPNWNTIKIFPIIGSLNYAHGSIPTSFGNITINWEKIDDDLIIDLSLPEPISGEFQFPIPFSSITQIYESEILIWEGEWLSDSPRIKGIYSENSQYLCGTLDTGDYHFLIKALNTYGQ